MVSINVEREAENYQKEVIMVIEHVDVNDGDLDAPPALFISKFYPQCKTASPWDFVVFQSGGLLFARHASYPSVG